MGAGQERVNGLGHLDDGLLQAAGWYLRSDIIWYKPNCQPESVKDRPTRAHEYLFLFSKSEDYFYDHKAILEPATSKKGTRNRRTV